MAETVVRAAELTKYYGEARGIVGLDLEVGRGEVFGFLGPNGAGKTTTIRLMLDLIRPTSGRVELLGHDVATAGASLRERIGYLPGELSLYENLTGEQLLRHLSRLHGGVDWAEVERLSSMLGAELGRRIRELSKGNKQKIGLVQAFMGRPELVILDEPTGGLDPLVQQTFDQLVQETVGDGRTVFLSSHNLGEVETLCDRVGIIRDGRLMAVQRVSEMRAMALRRMTVTFGEVAPEGAFAGLPEVTASEADGNRLHLTVQGSVDQVIKTAGFFEVVDIVSHEPSLEELFLAFYGGDGA